MNDDAEGNDPECLDARTVETLAETPRAVARGTLGRSWRYAAVFTLGYFLIGLAWVGSNPPGHAPDESDHLVKALALARFDIGVELEKEGATPIERRLISTSRVVSIPLNLVPGDYSCAAFKPTVTAGCLPRETPSSRESVEQVTAMGGYPPFGYFLPGLAARQMDSPYRAFIAARLVLLVLCSLLVLAGAFHLIRWLGRWALLGAFVVLTPMAVFVASSVTTSGLDIMAAFAVSAVVIVAIRRPDSLWNTGTLITLAITGSALALSRQLGFVTLAFLLLTGALCVGWRTLRALFVERTSVAVACTGVLFASSVAVNVWERTYDHPAETGPAFSADALGGFFKSGIDVFRSSIGVFGWLDAPLPGWSVVVWLLLGALVWGMASVLGERRDRWCLALTLLVALTLTYITHAVGFQPFQAGVQGRAVMPMFVFGPLFAGVIVSERLQRDAPDAIPRLYGVVALATAFIHLLAVYWNGRRYAVGTNGRVFYLGDPLWSPRFGWVPWLLLALAGSVLLAVYGVRCGRVAFARSDRLTSRSRPIPDVGVAHTR